jgi:isocitrate dehydrogenase
LATQDKNPDLKAKFTTLAQQLKENEGAIVAELIEAQGQSVEIDGYYHPDEEKVSQAMRPSGILNGAIAAFA